MTEQHVGCACAAASFSGSTTVSPLSFATAARSVIMACKTRGCPSAITLTPHASKLFSSGPSIFPSHKIMTYS